MRPAHFPAAIFFAAFLFVACDEAPKPPSPTVLNGSTFGTTFHIEVNGVSEDVAAEVVSTTLKRIDNRMSGWRENSELRRLSGGTEPFAVSPETFAVVRQSLDLAAATNGAFDPTVEPLLHLWGFRGQKRTSPPTKDELAEARSTVGYERVELQFQDGIATVDANGATLDLSAMAKGYAVDAVVNALSQRGGTAMLVEIGGEVRTTGSRPQTGAWVLAIDEPKLGGVPGANPLGLLTITNASVATSGNYRTAYQIEDQWVAHTMNASTGRPTKAAPLSVSVIAPDCTTADGWATALMVLGYEKGHVLVDSRPELQAIWVLPSGDVKMSGNPNFELLSNP